MAKRNKHENSIWVNETLVKCPKRKCTGILIHCAVSYRPGGPINYERECSECSFVKKDPRFHFKYKHLYKQQNNSQYPKHNPPSKYRKPGQ